MDFFEVTHGSPEEMDFIKKEAPEAVTRGEIFCNLEKVGSLLKGINGKIERILLKGGELFEKNGLASTSRPHDSGQMPTLFPAQNLKKWAARRYLPPFANGQLMQIEEMVE
jgi:hypothetical protein